MVYLFITHMLIGHLLVPGPGLSAGEAAEDEVKLIVSGPVPPTHQWSHRVSRAMVGAPWELQEPRGAPVTPARGAVMEGFLEEVALSEGAHLCLQPLSMVQRLGLGPLPASQGHPNPNPSAQPVNKSKNIYVVGP